MVAFAGNLAGLRVGDWLGLLPWPGSSGTGGSAGGLGVRGLVCPFGVRAGAVGWEGGGGLPVTSAYLWDWSPYKSLVAGTVTLAGRFLLP
jgi:hypothetical protein